MAQSAPVVEGVIAHLMSVGDNLFVQLRILPYIIANHEERCLHTILAERDRRQRLYIQRAPDDSFAR